MSDIDTQSKSQEKPKGNPYRRKGKERYRKNQAKYNMKKIRGEHYKHLDRLDLKLKNLVITPTSEKEKETFEKFDILIGCTPKFLYERITNQLSTIDPKMTWDNYGIYWEIEHLLGCKRNDKNYPEERLKYYNWWNLIPKQIDIKSQEWIHKDSRIQSKWAQKNLVPHLKEMDNQQRKHFLTKNFPKTNRPMGKNKLKKIRKQEAKQEANKKENKKPQKKMLCSTTRKEKVLRA